MYTPRSAWFLIMQISLWTLGHASPGNLCQSKINRQNNVCYWVEVTTDTYTKAQQRCAANGGNLATVDSVETSEFLKDFFDKQGLNLPKVWIGYDENKQTQTWEDGTPFSWSNYYSGQPDNKPCTSLNMRQNSEWFGRFCYMETNSLCQVHLTPSRQFDFVGVDQGSTVSVGDRVVVVQSDSVDSCAVECAGDAYCFVFRYIHADTTCTMYNSGRIIKTADNHGEWYVY